MTPTIEQAHSFLYSSFFPDKSQQHIYIQCGNIGIATADIRFSQHFNIIYRKPHLKFIQLPRPILFNTFLNVINFDEKHINIQAWNFN